MVCGAFANGGNFRTSLTQRGAISFLRLTTREYCYTRVCAASALKFEASANRRRTVAVRSPYGRCTVAVRSPYGRSTVAVWELKRFLHSHEKGILTEVMFFIAIVEICFVSQTATVRRPYGDRAATVRRPCAKPAPDQYLNNSHANALRKTRS